MRFKRNAVIALLVLAAGLTLVACGGDDGSDDGGSAGGGYGGGATTQTDETPPPKPAVETIVVRNGAPVDGVAELEFDAGEQVRFRVRSNVADEVHVHGYDVEEEVPAGGTATFSFPADIEGIFEVELHESEQQIAELRVNP